MKKKLLTIVTICCSQFLVAQNNPDKIKEWEIGETSRINFSLDIFIKTKPLSSRNYIDLSAQNTLSSIFPLESV